MFLDYAGDKGYGLVDCELYIPKEWFGDKFVCLRKECHTLEEHMFFSKNEIARSMINQVIGSGQFQWVGCDAVYVNGHAFLKGLELLKDIWYFSATNAKEQVFLEYQEMIFPGNEKRLSPKAPSTFPWSLDEMEA